MKACYKLWLESEDGKFILGEGTAELLHAIEKSGGKQTCGQRQAHGQG